MLDSIKDFFRKQDYDLDITFKLDPFHPFNQKYMNLPPGQEAYKLYKYIADNCPYSFMSEFGVLYGASLKVFASNKNKFCYAFDRRDQRYGLDDINISFFLVDAIEALETHRQQIRCSQLIHFDTLHDGEHELLFYNKLKEFWHGVIIFDDIHLNNEMTSFFNNIKEEKYDLTNIGHWSGTGVVLL